MLQWFAKSINVATLTLTTFDLKLFIVGWLYKGLPKKPNNIDEQQEREKCKSTCRKNEKTQLMSALVNQYLDFFQI